MFAVVLESSETSKHWQLQESDADLFGGRDVVQNGVNGLF